MIILVIADDEAFQRRADGDDGLMKGGVNVNSATVVCTCAAKLIRRLQEKNGTRNSEKKVEIQLGNGNLKYVIVKGVCLCTGEFRDEHFVVIIDDLFPALNKD